MIIMGLVNRRFYQLDCLFGSSFPYGLLYSCCFILKWRRLFTFDVIVFERFQNVIIGVLIGWVSLHFVVCFLVIIFSLLDLLAGNERCDLSHDVDGGSMGLYQVDKLFREKS